MMFVLAQTLTGPARRCTRWRRVRFRLHRRRPRPAERRPRAPASGRRSNSAGTFGHGPRWIAAMVDPPTSGGLLIHVVPLARARPSLCSFPSVCEQPSCQLFSYSQSSCLATLKRDQACLPHQAPSCHDSPPRLGLWPPLLRLDAGVRLSERQNNRASAYSLVQNTELCKPRITNGPVKITGE